MARYWLTLLAFTPEALANLTKNPQDRAAATREMRWAPGSPPSRRAIPPRSTVPHARGTGPTRFAAQLTPLGDRFWARKGLFAARRHEPKGRIRRLTLFK